MRIRIAELMLVVAAFAFATVSLMRADELFEMLFFNFTLIVILISLVMAIGRSQGSQAFWVGFFAASSLYLGCAHLPDAYQYSPRYGGPEVTTRLLRIAGEQLHPNAFESDLPGIGGFFSVQEEPETPFADLMETMDESFQNDEFVEYFDLSINVQGGQTIVQLDDPLVFMLIGHAAWALLFGWIAGHASRFVYERSRSGVV